jgi:HK97 family phage prohead protease
MSYEYISVPLELKSLEANQFEGYGSTFGNVDLGGDVVVRGAFRKSLEQWKADDALPQMYWNHNRNEIPGRWLEMHEDSKGLRVSGEFLPTRSGQDVQILAKSKAIRGLSIGFSLDSEKSFEFKDGIRMLKEINLWEVSPVGAPMNPKAKISAVKAAIYARGMSLADVKRQTEKFLREIGLTRSHAIACASQMFAEDEYLCATQSPGDEHTETVRESQSDSGEANGDERAAIALAEKFLVGCIKEPRLA